MRQQHDLFSHQQQVALALLPKFSGFLSIISSVWIVIEVLKEPSKRSNVYHRLICGMSIWDGIVSASMFLSTWPMPTNGEDEENTVWAIGNNLTCLIQGTFIQFSIAPPIYNLCLSLYYMLVVKYKYSEKQVKKIEPYLQLVPNLAGTGTAFYGLFHGIYGSAMLWCWIEPDDTQYRWAMYYIPLWIVIVLITIIMIVVYRTVERREMKMILDETSGRTSFVTVGSEKSYVHQQQGSERSFRGSLTATGGTTDGNHDSGLFLLPEPMVDALRKARASRTSMTLQSTPSQEASDHDKNFMADALQRASLNRDPNHSQLLSSNGPNKNPSIISGGGVLDAEQVMDAIGGFASVKQQQSVESNKLGSRAVFRQSLYYTLSFYAVYFFPTLNRILELHGYDVFTIFLLHATCIPLQGFLNLVVYRYPFYKRLKQRYPEMSRWQRVRQSIRWSFLGPIQKSDKVTPTQMQSFHRTIDPSNSNNMHSNLLEDGITTSNNQQQQQQPMDFLSDDFDPSIGRSSMMQAIIDDMLDFDHHGDFIGNDFHDQMESDLDAVYSEFPTALTEDTVVVPTDFPVVLRRMSIPEGH